jgi:hypothetical protein
MNFLYPAKDTLACSENWFGDQPIFAPIYLLTGNPVAAHNTVILASCFLCALFMYLLMRWLTGNVLAAWIAGFIYGFAFPRLSALDHMQLLNTHWIPLAVLFLFAFFRSKRVLYLILMCASLLMQVLCSLYLGYLGVLILACYFVALFITNRDLFRWRELTRLALGAVITVLLLVPVVRPYLHLEKQGTINEEVQTITTIKASASPIATYLEVKGWPKHPYASLLDRFGSVEYGWEKRFFMGFLAMALGLVGILWLRRRKPPVAIGAAGFSSSGTTGTLGCGHPELWRAAIYGSIFTIITSYVISLGPFLRIHDRVTSVRLPFYYLREVVPGFGAFRVPARFGFALLFGLAVLAGFGFLFLLDRLSKPGSRSRAAVLVTLTLLATVFMSVEYRVAPYQLLPIMTPSSIAPEYRWLAQQPAGSGIVELPITGGAYFPDPWEQSSYLFASMYHWQPLLNGYTSHRPEVANHTYTVALQLPSEQAASILQSIGLRFVVVHADKMSEHELSPWNSPHPGLRQVEEFGPTRIYEFDAPQCATGLVDLNLKLVAPEESDPGKLFGFQLIPQLRNECWVDKTAGLKALQGEWRDTSGQSQIARTKVTVPLYATLNSPQPILGYVKAPKGAGDYSFRVVSIGGESLNLPGQKVALAPAPAANSINAPRDLAATYRVESVPQKMQAGVKNRIIFTATNTGTAEWLSVWPPGKGSTGLGYRWLDTSGKEIQAGRLYLPYAVFPGKSFQFDGGIDAPSTPGNYILSLEMVSELVAWFHDNGVSPVTIPVTVVSDRQ